MRDKITILAIICILLFSVFPVSIGATDVRHITGSRLSFLHVTITKSDLDKVKTIQLPYNERLNAIRIVDRKQTTKPAEMPSQTFTRVGDDFNGTTDFAYTQPYYCNAIKKTDGQQIDILVPSTYYDNNTENQIENLTLELTIETNIDTLPSMYIQEDEQVNYLIITTSSLYSTFNNEFKPWKLATDPEINSITILNVSDIVNTPEYWVNGTWGDGTNSSQGNQWVDNGRQVKNNFSMFNDTQCRIRNCIRKYVATYGTSYVLLAGNKDLVPPRIVFTPAHSGPDGTWYNYTSATDMYYGSLYCNWNNNTDGLWGEDRLDFYWAKTPVWDDINYGFDVTVGRALIDSVSSAEKWITKTKEYVNGNTQGKGNYLQWQVLAAKDVSNNIDSYVWSQIGDEFPANMTFVNGQNISQAQWNNLANYANGVMPGVNGLNMIYHSGHGGTLYTSYNPSNCYNNVTANFVYTEGCQEADFGLTTNTDMERWMKDDGCLFSGIGNTAYGWFIASTWYGEEMMKRMFNDAYGEHEMHFAVANDEARESIGVTMHSVCPMLFKELNYFGDPAMEYQWYQSTSYYNITGKIYYNGSGTSSIKIGLFNEVPDENSTPVQQMTVASPGQYSFTVTNGTYYIGAFMDLNGNQYADATEPMGYAINKTIDVAPDPIMIHGNNINNANVILYHNDYYNITGCISYNGTESGMIYVVAFKDEIANPAGPITFTNISGPGSYSLRLANGTYYIISYLDANGNQAFETYGDPLGVAINKTISEFWSADQITINGTDVDGTNMIIYDWPVSHVSPTNNATHVGIYDRNLAVKVLDQNGTNMDVLFKWANGTDIQAFYNVPSNTTVTVHLQDVMETWLPHDTIFSWYVTIIENETEVLSTDLFNFTTSKAWDLNEDGYCNAVDISGLVNHMGSVVSPPGSQSYDIDDDGAVNAIDISMLVNHLGEQS